MQIKTAVMACAGRGTRLGRFAEATPKELIALGGLPAIVHSMQEARAAGIEDFILVISPEKRNAFEAIFHPNHRALAAHTRTQRDDVVKILRDIEELGRRTQFVVQSKPLGLGHAVMQSERRLGGQPFAVMHPDDVVVGAQLMKSMLARYETSGAMLVGAEAVPRERISSYGCIAPMSPSTVEPRVGEAFAVRGLVEKPAPEEAPSNLSLMGRFILPGEIHEAIRMSKPDVRGEVNLTDPMQMLIAAGQPAEFIELLPEMGRHFDIGTEKSYLHAYRSIDDVRLVNEMDRVILAMDGMPAVAHPGAHVWFGRS